MEWQARSHTFHIFWIRKFFPFWGYLAYFHPSHDFIHTHGWRTVSIPVFSVLFIIFGLCLAIGPLVAELLRYRNTEYAITNQRLIAQTGVIGLDARFVELNKMQEVYVTIGLLDKIYGTGSIIAVTAGYVPVGTPSNYGVLVRPAFKAVKNPYEVQRLLQEALKACLSKG